MAHRFPIRCECNQLINHKYKLFKWLTNHTHKEVVAELEPSNKRKRERVPSEQKKGTIDSYFKDGYDPSALVSNAEALDILRIPKQNYCCRTKFMTFVEVPDMDPTLYENCSKVEIIMKPITEVLEPRKFIAR